MDEAMRLYFDWLVGAWRERFGTLPQAPYEEDVDPSIYVGEPDDDEYIQWQPTPKDVGHDLVALESRLGVALPRSLQDYFNAYWFCSLGGTYHGVGIDLEPVPPGRELDGFCRMAIGYRESHEGPLSHLPIGVEKNGMLVVVDLRNGVVSLEDCERGSFEPLAPGLAELIAGLR